MVDEVEKILKQLVGLELTKTTRAGAMECLKFGVFYKRDRKGIDNQIGIFGLHLQCPWRITKNDIILVGSDDVVEQPDEKGEFDDSFDWDVQGGNLRDVKLENMLKSEKLVVKSVVADNLGGFQLVFHNNITLSVFPTSSSKSFYSEYWRLLVNKNNPKHFVVSIGGVYEI